ncbi:TPA: hypothetical protein I0I03_RS10425 [Enterococcus faecium]
MKLLTTPLTACEANPATAPNENALFSEPNLSFSPSSFLADLVDLSPKSSIFFLIDRWSF